MTIPWFLLGRIATAAALGGVIGYERDLHRRPAGLRTHMIVALASATFMAVSTHFIEHQTYSTNQKIDVDVSRIAASIVTGIGFLGGGAILRTGLNVQGLTTAAGLWLVGAIGMAAGGGMYVVALFSTGLGLLALGLLRRFEDKDNQPLVHRVRVVLGEPATLAEIEARLARLGGEAELLQLHHDVGASRIEAEYEVNSKTGADAERWMALLNDTPGIRSTHIELDRT